MTKTKFLLALLLCFLAFGAFVFVALHEKTVLNHPEGIIARKQHHLIMINTLLMVVILVPTFILVVTTAWKYRAQARRDYDPEKKTGAGFETLLWIIPSIIVVIMAWITWNKTHELDPYKPLVTDSKGLKIQVVALNWKWLFIYPEQKIASVNLVRFPEKRAIDFELTADNSPMNSFWIPQLSGQIYCMTGMITPLHIMADGPGCYSGKAAEINGEGYAKMTFVAESTSQEEFDKWVTEVKNSPLRLDDATFNELAKPSVGHPQTVYSTVKEDLFHHIVMKVNIPEKKP